MNGVGAIETRDGVLDAHVECDSWRDGRVRCDAHTPRLVRPVEHRSPDLARERYRTAGGPERHGFVVGASAITLDSHHRGGPDAQLHRENEARLEQIVRSPVWIVGPTIGVSEEVARWVAAGRDPAHVKAAPARVAEQRRCAGPECPRTVLRRWKKRVDIESDRGVSIRKAVPFRAGGSKPGSRVIPANRRDVDEWRSEERVR